MRRQKSPLLSEWGKTGKSLGIIFFLREAKFRLQTNEKKKTFSELSTEEIQEITDNDIPAATKKPQSLGFDYSMIRILYALRIHEGFYT